MRSNSAARASPAGVSGGSARSSVTFSACRTTIIVVESAVAQIQASKLEKPKKLKMSTTASPDNQMGVKNGRRCNLAWFVIMAA
jgi:hypothetical protein